MLFSATLDGADPRLVDRYLHDPVAHEVESDEPTVDEMEHRFFYVHQLDKVKVRRRDLPRRRADARVHATPSARPTGSCAAAPQVKASRRRRSTATSRQAARERALADFSRRARCRCSSPPTSPRAGIHIDGVDVVVHYDPTDDPKSYLHRSGRTARAGEAGVAVTLMLWNQENDVRTVQRRLALDRCRSSRCSRTTRASPTCAPGTRPTRPTSPDPNPSARVLRRVGG